MAITVASFTAPNWDDTASGTRTVTGVSWNSGEFIVAGGTAFDASLTLTTPTNASLTFSLLNSQTDGGTAEVPVWFWTAVAGSTQSGQTISTTISDAARKGGICVWVISGQNSVIAAGNNRTESAFSYNPTAGSAVLYFVSDFNATAAGRTGTTGTGTLTERQDVTASAAFWVGAYDWVGVTSGANNYGITDYTSLKVGHLLAEVTEDTGPPVPGPALHVVQSNLRW